MNLAYNLQSTVLDFFSRFLCRKTCYDVLITKHDVSYESIVKYRNNYDLKIANGQLVDLFVVFLRVFFRKSFSFFPSFPSLFPFLLSFILRLLSHYSACQRCTKLHCQLLVQPQTALEQEVGARPRKNGENFSFNRRFLPILRISRVFSSTLLYGKLKTVANPTRGYRSSWDGVKTDVTASVRMTPPPLFD